MGLSSSKFTPPSLLKISYLHSSDIFFNTISTSIFFTVPELTIFNIEHKLNLINLSKKNFNIPFYIKIIHTLLSTFPLDFSLYYGIILYNNKSDILLKIINHQAKNDIFLSLLITS